MHCRKRDLAHRQTSAALSRRLTEQVDSLQVAMWLRGGDVLQAAGWLARLEASGQSDRDASWPASQRITAAWTKISLQQYPAAQELLEELIREPDLEYGLRLSVDLLQAAAAVGQEMPEAARRGLLEAARRALTGGYRLPIQWIGAPFAAELGGCFQAGVRVSRRRRSSNCCVNCWLANHRSHRC